MKGEREIIIITIENDLHQLFRSSVVITTEKRCKTLVGPPANKCC